MFGYPFNMITLTWYTIPYKKVTSKNPLQLNLDLYAMTCTNKVITYSISS